jgi:two-component system nitrate/nitrite sensor histidine kinase NarX
MRSPQRFGSTPEISPSTAVLAEVAAGVAAADDVTALVQRLLEPLVDLAGAHGGAVRVLDEQGQRLRLVSSIGLSDAMCRAESSVDRHCGYCGTAADDLRVVWADDLSSCSSKTGVARPCVLPTQRMLTVPMRHRQRVLGVYNLYFTRTVPEQSVLQLLQTVGELLGLALENARLEAESLRATLMRERQVMAAEVHDSIAQSLAFVKLRLPLLHDAMVARDDAHAEQYFDDVRGSISQAHTGLRCLLTQFRAPMEPGGLLAALGACTATFRRMSGCDLSFESRLPWLQISPEEETHVFHIVKEALSNISKHAQARHAWLSLHQLDDGVVEVLVDDDGNGLPDTAHSDGHYGLDIMHERAGRIGGLLSVEARPGGGTRVRLTFPVVAPMEPSRPA